MYCLDAPRCITSVIHIDEKWYGAGCRRSYLLLFVVCATAECCVCLIYIIKIHLIMHEYMVVYRGAPSATEHSIL